MQITKLIIDNWLCLVGFEINFKTNKRGSSTILIGENGTGKSTMIDVILEILMSFDSPAIEKKIAYAYEIQYKYAQTSHTIKKEGHNYYIQVGAEKFRGNYSAIKKKLSDKRIFPERIITFYSGANNKIIDKIQHQNILYVSKCRDILKRYLNSMVDASIEGIYNFPKRKYNYCDETLIPIYLASILAGNSSFEKKYLQKNCHISSLQIIIVSIDLTKISLNQNLNEDNFTIFQKIIGFIDDRFLDFFQVNTFDKNSKKSYFVIDKLETKGIDPISILEFFEKLYSLFDAEFQVYVSLRDCEVEVGNMSEGQRQIIKVLGMLGICKSEDCLVMMDEPDAHMNPTWKYEIKKTIDNCLREAINTQAIIATHDPLVINGVSKEFIRIFVLQNEIQEGKISKITKVIEPSEDTEGLGIDGLLQSEYYGLKTSYDKKTSNKFIKRLKLYSKLINGEASDEEKEILRKLTIEIGALPVSYNSIDFLYDDFVQVFKKSNLFSKEYLSYDEVLLRRKQIKMIIEKLYKGKQ